jgi:hypothetical protein
MTIPPSLAALQQIHRHVALAAPHNHNFPVRTAPPPQLQQQQPPQPPQQPHPQLQLDQAAQAAAYRYMMQHAQAGQLMQHAQAGQPACSSSHAQMGQQEAAFASMHPIAHAQPHHPMAGFHDAYLGRSVDIHGRQLQPFCMAPAHHQQLAAAPDQPGFNAAPGPAAPGPAAAAQPE